LQTKGKKTKGWGVFIGVKIETSKTGERKGERRPER